MPSVFSRTVLFLSGYLPLFLIFTIQYYPRFGYWALAPVVVGILALAYLLFFVQWVRRGERRPLRIISVERKDSEIIAYIFAYVFPFLGLDVSNTASAIGLGIFFAVLLVLNVSANMIHINPALSLLGYHIYEIQTDADDSHTVLTRRDRLVRGTEIGVVPIGDSISMEKELTDGSNGRL